MASSLLRDRPSRLRRLEALVQGLLETSGEYTGKGVPFFKNAGEFQVHVNPVKGRDEQQSDGSPARPFQTFRAVYQRMAFLSDNAYPDLSKILTPATPTFHVFFDTPFPQPNPTQLAMADPATILLDVYCPRGGTLIIDGSPAQTSTALSGVTVAQAQNYALNPAHFQVLTLISIVGTADSFFGKLLVNVNTSSSAWVYRAGNNGGGLGPPQVAGAQNIQVSRFLGPSTLAPPFNLANASNFIWPAVPTSPVVGAGNPVSAITLPILSCATGGTGFTVRGSIAGLSSVSAQAFVYRCGFVDGGAFKCSGYGAQMSFVECSFTDICDIEQATSVYNCHFSPLVVERALDNYVLGGWYQNKLGINQATNVVVDGIILDQCTMQVGPAGGVALNLGEVGIYLTNPAPGIDLATGTIGAEAGVYTNMIGFASNSLLSPFRTTAATFFRYNFAFTFGALGGAPDTIGFYPYPLAIYASDVAILDPYTGALGGEQTGTQVYPVSKKSGIDAVGHALTNALTVQPGGVTEFYVNTLGGTGWSLEVNVSTTVSTDAGGATVSYQIFVDGAAGSDPVQGPFVIPANGSLDICRTVRFQNLASGLHTFQLALVASSGSASTAANNTRVNTSALPAA